MDEDCDESPLDATIDHNRSFGHEDEKELNTKVNGIQEDYDEFQMSTNPNYESNDRVKSALLINADSCEEMDTDVNLVKDSNKGLEESVGDMEVDGKEATDTQDSIKTNFDEESETLQTKFNGISSPSDDSIPELPPTPVVSDVELATVLKSRVDSDMDNTSDHSEVEEQVKPKKKVLKRRKSKSQGSESPSPHSDSNNADDLFLRVYKGECRNIIFYIFLMKQYPHSVHSSGISGISGIFFRSNT